MTEHPNEHPTDVLLAVAQGTPPPPAVAAHVETCARCRGALEALAPLDLAGAWEGVLAELDTPRQCPVERLAVAVGIRPWVARVVATTPSLSPAWLVATGLVLLLGTLLLGAAPATALSPALVVAPLVAAAAVAFAYGPGVDPAYDAVAVTPASPVRILLARLTAVLAADALLVAAAGTVLGGGAGVAWPLPMAGAALLAALVASRTHPGLGAAAGMAAWLAVLLGLRVVFGAPLEVLASPRAQAAAAAVAAILLATLLYQSSRSAWPPGRAAI